MNNETQTTMPNEGIPAMPLDHMVPSVPAGEAAEQPAKAPVQGAPKVFLSYGWAGHDHIERVSALADALVKNGIEVVFDQYDLGEDDDVAAYMENALDDPSVSKILLLCDSYYKEKADDGGDSEADDRDPVVFKEVYERLSAAGSSRRFLPIVMERDPGGKAYLPSYLKNRKYIDMSLGAVGGFDLLLRHLHGKPLRARPEPGPAPLRATREKPLALGTTMAYEEALKAIRSGTPTAKLLCEEFLELFVANLSAYKLDEYNQEQLLKSLDSFLPARDQFVDVLVGAIRSNLIADLLPAVRRFFESLYVYTEPTDSLYSWKEAMLDHFKYLMNECFLYGMAALLRYEQFSLIPAYLSDFYIPTKKRRNSDLLPYVNFLFHLKSLEIENSNKQLKRFDLHCDYLHKNATRLDIRFQDVMQADFFLYLFDKLHQVATYGMGWIPRTLLYAAHMSGPFEVFARATSLRYFERFKAALCINNVQDLTGLRALFQMEQERLRFGSEPRDFITLANLDNLGRRP